MHLPGANVSQHNATLCSTFTAMHLPGTNVSQHNATLYIPIHSVGMYEELLGDVFYHVGAAVSDAGMSCCIFCTARMDALNYG